MTSIIAQDYAVRMAQLRQECSERARETSEMMASAAQAGLSPQTAIVRHREPIDGDATLRYLYTMLSRYAQWGSSHEVVTSALWAAATHARYKDGTPVWQYCPRLGIFGPSGSGKSWKARLVGKLSYKPEILIEPTKPAFIDLCADHSTVILTEADEAFRSPGRSRGILAVVNASWEPDRSAAKVRGGVAIKVPLFTFVVLDAIDSMLSANRPDLNAMLSRCLILHSRTADPQWRAPRYDQRARGIADQLARRTAAWMAQEVEDGIADEIPQLPEAVANRSAALWEPLFVTAARADASWRRRERVEDDDTEGPWTVACREACEHLESAGRDEDDDQALSELDRQMSEWGA